MRRNIMIRLGSATDGLLAPKGGRRGRNGAVAFGKPEYSEQGIQFHIPHDATAPQQAEDLRFRLPDNRVYRLGKRLMDILVSLVALALFGAMLPLLALLIKLDSRGPIFFHQQRIGINRRRRRSPTYAGPDKRKILQPGRPFRIHKLRTMVIDAEEGGPRWATRNDARITRVGRVLRKTRLDEVPQFYNVLRGDMSLIGPRPERLCFIRQLEKEVPSYLDRLLVLPGITGLAQVVNGYDESTESVKRKVTLDCMYIKKSGVLFDLKILLSTIKVVITGQGAY